MNSKTIIILLSLGLLLSCNQDRYAVKPGAHGMAGNIMVVVNNNEWNSEPGDSIRAVFHQYCRALPRSEHLFTLHQVEKEQFIGQNRYHRNVVYVNISTDVEDTQVRILRERFARRQLFVELSAPNQKEFGELISNYKDRLINLFLEEDRDRYRYHLHNHRNERITEILRKDYDVILNIPRNYTLDVRRDNFVWISYDARKHSLGIFVYHYPLTDTSSLELDYLISMRNKILKENVPGDKPGSYMSTEVRFYPPYIDIIEHNNQNTAYIQGLWRVQGDFMGGPFINYTKIDRQRNRIISAEGWVYSPNRDQRDHIRRLDAILYGFDLVR